MQGRVGGFAATRSQGDAVFVRVRFNRSFRAHLLLERMIFKNFLGREESNATGIDLSDFRNLIR